MCPPAISVHCSTVTDANTTLVPVILSGGSGTRLWPASRLTQPKQLLPLVSDRSMLLETIDRVAAMGHTIDPIIVTNKGHVDIIERELTSSGYADATLILEPIGRNTAPAVAVAALEAMKHGDPLILVLPSDHTISDEKAFHEAIAHGATAAAAGYLVTFGITPRHPETGYGYIRVGDPISSAVDRVLEFKEKPDSRTAEAYLASGEYLWNSGMFLMRASRYLEELKRHAPDIASASLLAFTRGEQTGRRILLDSEAFAACRSDSIDYAVMEPTSRAAVVQTDPGWNDVGSWKSLLEIADKDSDGNVLLGDTIAINTSGAYVRSTSRLVATVGIKDLIVVETVDAVLVTNTESAQDVKAVVDKLLEDKRPELVSNAETAPRPWGQVRRIESDNEFRVTRLSLDRESETPLKSHGDRAETWIVVGGVASVASGEETRTVRRGESVVIPPGVPHRLKNIGDDVLEVIAVDVFTEGPGPDGRTEREE